MSNRREDRIKAILTDLGLGASEGIAEYLDQHLPPNPALDVVGYRTLSTEEIARMNTVKAVGASLSVLIEEMLVDPTVDLRSVNIAREQLQTGLMWLTRAVAKPESF